MSRAERPVDDQCIFCKIAAGSVPCARVYEDESVIAFLDLSPVAKGHTLVVPRGHYPTLLDFPSPEGAGLLRALQKVACAVQQETQASGFNCVQNNFGSAGQTVFHSHWHIIPRHDGDALPDWPGKSYASDREMQTLAQSISARIQVGVPEE